MKVARMAAALLAALATTFPWPGEARAEQPLTGAQILALFSGNSIVHPSFGCVYFATGRDTVGVLPGGETRAGSWGVRADLYISSGQCGDTGCTVTGGHPEAIFRRVDGGYTQAVSVIRGNHCERDGVIS